MFNRRLKFYRQMASVFLTFLIINSFLLVPLVAFDMIVEAWMDLLMMAVNGGLLVHACWRISQLRIVEEEEQP